MDESQLVVTCRRIYAETNAIYNRYQKQLGANDYGFKILYGPPRLNPPVLFIGDQPGGRIADEKPHERFGWPSECEYATETWTLARNMQAMFQSSFLMDCVGINANFFRSPCSKRWKTVHSSLRGDLEAFCYEQMQVLISEMAPKLIIVIGFSTLDRFGATDPILYGTKKRVLMRRGRLGPWPAFSTRHLSGARIGKEDRSMIAAEIIKLASDARISQLEKPGSTAPALAKTRCVRAAVINAHNTAIKASRNMFDLTDPKLAIELLDKLEKFGFNNQAFRKLHHSQKETINGFRKWCLKTTNFVPGGNNARVHERLNYVLQAYLQRGLPPGQSDVFIELAQRAYSEIPPLP